MFLTDWCRWPVLSHNQACRNALQGAVETARHRRDVLEAERFVAEANRRRYGASTARPEQQRGQVSIATIVTRAVARP